jgi:proteic killer suppression protein
LNVAVGPADLARPSWRLHGLSGDRAGYLSITVQANWRLVFRFDGTNVELLDYLDYH